MKHSTGFSITTLFVFAGLAACGSETTGSTSVPDAGPALPDATVPPTRIPDPPDPEFATPTLVQVTPPSGPETGGARVLLRGTSFVEPAEVSFGGAPATNVVVLDEVSIAATTPAGPIGRVTVEVTTPGGVAELPEGYRYHLDLQINAVEPARVPEEGGVMVTVRGKGFDADTLVLFDRVPLNGAEVVDAETIRGFVPALDPGRPEVRVLNRAADVRRSDIVFVFATPEIADLAPGYGPIDGGAAQAVRGDGFEGAERVMLGGDQAGDLSITTGEELQITSPALTEGVHDVAVSNADASDTLVGAFIAYDATRVGREILGVTPNQASSAGGDVVTVVGYGFAGDSVVDIGGQRVVVSTVESQNAITVVVPAGLQLGPNDVTVATGGSTIAASAALTVYAPIVLSRASPDVGPASGGTEVSIVGSGFTSDTLVQIGGVPLADLVISNEGLITGTTQAGPHGPQDVVVYNRFTRTVLEDGFVFNEPFSILKLDPEEGSIAGNTYVSVIGRGLSATSSITFDGIGLDPDTITLENGSVLSMRTLPTPAGWVDVEVMADADEHVFPQGFLFYDPRIITGGAWGGPIEGSVNVGVLNINSGEPMPGMVVQLGVDGDLRYAGVTDENGLVTISSPEIRGPRTVTAGQNQVEHVTYMDLRSRNLTVLASTYPMISDAPPQPCPMGGNAPTVGGAGFKIKSGLDEVTSPGVVALARCTYTWANMFRPNPPMPPTQVAFISQNGESFQITPVRAGTIAVYCVLGDFNETTQEFTPRRLGIARQVPSAADGAVSGINISFDIELNKSVELRLDRAPDQNPGPTNFSAAAFINLGSEGAIPVDWLQQTASEDGRTITLNRMPDLPGAQFFYRVGSYTVSPNGGNVAPNSECIAQSGAETEEGVDVGPFVLMPEDISPKVGDLLADGKISWTQPGPQPDITSMFVVDLGAAGGTCCVDGNQNGTCEPNEPLMGGSMPVQFTRWSVFGEGGLQSYDLPLMPPGVQAFDAAPRQYQYGIQQAVAPRFDYREFIYNQFSPFFWRCWSFTFSGFVAKERTR